MDGQNVSTDVIWMWVSWSIAITLTVVGTVIGCGWASSAEARMAGISILAFAVLATGWAVAVTVKLYVIRCTNYILGVMDTSRDAEQRIRQLRP
jgi:hypothetical protein